MSHCTRTFPRHSGGLQACADLGQLFGVWWRWSLTLLAPLPTPGPVSSVARSQGVSEGEESDGKVQGGWGALSGPSVRLEVPGGSQSPSGPCGSCCFLPSHLLPRGKPLTRLQEGPAHLRGETRAGVLRSRPPSPVPSRPPALPPSPPECPPEDGGLVCPPEDSPIFHGRGAASDSRRPSPAFLHVARPNAWEMQSLDPGVRHGSRMEQPCPCPCLLGCVRLPEHEVRALSTSCWGPYF